MSSDCSGWVAAVVDSAATGGFVAARAASMTSSRSSSVSAIVLRRSRVGLAGRVEPGAAGSGAGSGGGPNAAAATPAAVAPGMVGAADGAIGACPIVVASSSSGASVAVSSVLPPSTLTSTSISATSVAMRSLRSRLRNDTCAESSTMIDGVPPAVSTGGAIAVTEPVGRMPTPDDDSPSASRIDRGHLARLHLEVGLLDGRARRVDHGRHRLGRDRIHRRRAGGDRRAAPRRVVVGARHRLRRVVREAVGDRHRERRILRHRRDDRRRGRGALARHVVRRHAQRAAAAAAPALGGRHADVAEVGVVVALAH